MKENGKVVKEKDTVFRNGEMELVMKESGKGIRHMVKENFIMWMVMFLKENGKKTKLMVMEFIHM